mmetsp:Transcript_20512/g.52063  ORF Transcript_20512/g.52063 Transcript_20512/m.52063 type:complete len:434 (+) Transcript_20512:262-1563(+)
MRAAALLARLCGDDRLRGKRQHVLQLQRLDQVRVPDHGAVRDAHLLKGFAHVHHFRASLLQRLLRAENCGVALHDALHLTADRRRLERPGGVAQLVQVGDGFVARQQRQRLRHVTRLGDGGNVVGHCPAEHHDVEQRVGTQPVCAVHRGAGSLACGVEAGHRRVGGAGPGVEHLALVVGGDASHVVVHRGKHRDGLFGDVHAGEDGSGLGDARQTLGEHIGRQVVEVEVDVVLVGAHAAPLVDLLRHRTRDNIARGEVLRRRGVPLHEALSLRVAQDATLAARALGDQAARAVDASRVELHELEVLQRQPRARHHRVAVAGARVRRGCGEVGAAVPTRRDGRVVCVEAVQRAVLHVERHHAHALARVVHDEVERKVLHEELSVVFAGLPVERVQHRVASAVGRARAAVGLAALSVVERLAAEGALVDLALVGA